MKIDSYSFLFKGIDIVLYQLPAENFFMEILNFLLKNNNSYCVLDILIETFSRIKYSEHFFSEECCLKSYGIRCCH